MDLSKDIALVTGASRGIGAATALVLAKYGAKVAVNYHVEKGKAEQVAKKIEQSGGEAIILQADIGSKDDVDKMFTAIENEWGNISILVNNAGITAQADVADFPLEKWQEIIKVNLTGAMLCIQRAIPAMINARYGRIINIGSACGVRGCERSIAYSASKAGLHGLTRSIARDVAPLGVTCNTVSPGPIATEMLLALPEDILDIYRKDVPMGRFGEPEEIGETVAFLASRAASFITGQVIRVCGGHTI
ncbi:MAG: 3-oxoacyl-ACP reductase family protein [Candidatus Ranarchaeia archaeon]